MNKYTYTDEDLVALISSMINYLDKDYLAELASQILGGEITYDKNTEVYTHITETNF